MKQSLVLLEWWNESFKYNSIVTEENKIRSTFSAKK